MFLDSLFILAILCALVTLSEWLVQHTLFKYLGTALLVILLTAIVANTGIIPAGSPPDNPVPVYDGIFGYIAPLAIFFLLLQVNLKDVLKAGKPLLVLFALGVIGTCLGVLLGMWVIDGPALLGENFTGMGGMFVGTYIGGGINFNALAIHYGIVAEGNLYGAAVAVDNIMTTIWMMATIAIPKMLHPLWTIRIPGKPAQGSHRLTNIDARQISPSELGILLSAGFATLWMSNALSDWFASVGIKAPSIVLVSIIALFIAQMPRVQQIQGAQLLGTFCVTLFLAVIGAFCDISALNAIGTLGFNLLILVTIIVVVHGFVVFGAAWLFKMDPDMAAIASQANIGGAPSALALAQSLGRQDLVLPAVLIGSLGYALGTFIGLGVARFIFSAL